MAAPKKYIAGLTKIELNVVKNTKASGRLLFAEQQEKETTVVVGGKKKVCKAGDYLLTNNRNEIFICNKKIFEKLYEFIRNNGN